MTKTNTYRLETFQPASWHLGYADPDRIVFYRAPTRKHTIQSQFDLMQINEFPKVSILYSYSGDDGDLAKAALAAGAKGLVIAGTGAGHNPKREKALKSSSTQPAWWSCAAQGLAQAGWSVMTTGRNRASSPQIT